MRTIIWAVTIASVLGVPVAALANDGATGMRTDRFVLTTRAEYGQINSHRTDQSAGGGSLGLHIPLGDLPLGIHVASSLLTGGGHLASTSDVGLRYYLAASGDDPAKALQPYVRVMAALSIVSWDVQDTSATVGAGFGLGLQAWTWESVGFDLELSYRVMGGAELRQTLLCSLGFAFGL